MLSTTSKMSKRQTSFPIREDRQHKIEVHVAGFCFRRMTNTIQVLVGRRKKNRDLFPDRWECGGGQVYSDESFEEALRRQYVEEFGMEIRILYPLVVYEIHRERGPKIPGLKFLCVSTDNGNEQVALNHREFSECKWVAEREFKHLRTIPGVQEVAKLAFAGAKRHFIRPRQVPERIGFHK